MDFFGFINVPFASLLRFLTELLDSYALGLIVFALIVTVIRVPFDIKGKRGTMGTSLLQPKVKAIQEKYAGNQQKIMMETQKLYKEEGVKPMGGCFWMMIPMFIMIVLIGIVRQPLTHLMGLDAVQIETLREVAERLGLYVTTGAHLEVQLAGYFREYFAEFYAAVPQIFDINMRFLGMDIGRTPTWEFWNLFNEPVFPAAEFGLFFLPIISTGTVYLMQKVMTATNYMQQQQMQQMPMMKTMLLFMPLTSLFIGYTFPAAMSIYWIVNSLSFTLCSVFINMHFKKVFAKMREDMENREREKEEKLEAKRAETERLRALNATQENKGTSKKKKHVQEREKERQRQAVQRAGGQEDEFEEEVNPSRAGHRKYARGRAFDPERYERAEGEEQPDTDLDLDDADEQVTDVLPSLEAGEFEDELSADEDALTEEDEPADSDDDDDAEYYEDEDEDDER